MFDRYLIPLIKNPLNGMAKRLAAFSVRPNQVTVFGFLVGLLAALAIANQMYLLGVMGIVLNRVLDGLDGALARLTANQSDVGGYLDIVFDFIFYSAIIFGFAWANPDQNALAAAFLIWSFIGTGSSFLAFAIMAAKHKIERLEYGTKSLYFLGGMTEGSETIACFVLMCVLPNQFVLLAVVFGVFCWITTATRIIAAYNMLSSK